MISLDEVWEQRSGVEPEYDQGMIPAIALEQLERDMRSHFIAT